VLNRGLTALLMGGNVSACTHNRTTAERADMTPAATIVGDR
jgi:hypothetical protein